MKASPPLHLSAWLSARGWPVRDRALSSSSSIVLLLGFPFEEANFDKGNQEICQGLRQDSPDTQPKMESEQDVYLQQ